MGSRWLFLILVCGLVVGDENEEGVGNETQNSIIWERQYDEINPDVILPVERVRCRSVDDCQALEFINTEGLSIEGSMDRACLFHTCFGNVSAKARLIPFPEDFVAPTDEEVKEIIDVVFKFWNEPGISWERKASVLTWLLLNWELERLDRVDIEDIFCRSLLVDPRFIVVSFIDTIEWLNEEDNIVQFRCSYSSNRIRKHQVDVAMGRGK